MKNSFLILMILFSCAARSQKTENILAFIKAKYVDSVIKHCSFPFDLRAGSMIDDADIPESMVLRKKISTIV